MHTHTRSHFLASTILIAVGAFLPVGHLAAAPPVPPDLTQSNTVDCTLTFNLGATGLRGWIYSQPASSLDAIQGRTTAASRQILVTHVGTNSPAWGVMEVNDVIVGVGNTRFSDDARKSFARAITEAEKAENGGILKLLRFRAGKTDTARLKLRVLGSYSATAPYDCPKSRLILADACKALEKEPLDDSWCGAVSGLALLATGKPEYLPRVREFARAMASKNLELGNGDHCDSWSWGFKDVFLSEYYLATGDKEVLPGIKAFTVTLARGQSLYGTFGHGGSWRTPEGKLHGSIPPYGPVNQAGLIANLGIVMGKKCGVNDPEVDAAIGRASKFFGYFVDKGCIPYGEHEPLPLHDNNGKSAMAALLFKLQGNRPAEARYFAKMSTAAYENREYGHTGQGFSYLWGGLGAHVGGPAAGAAFFKEAAWHLDLVRRCDGTFTYDGGEQHGPGRTEDNTYYGKSSYSGLSPNATYVLTYAAPLRKICITGKELKKEECLSKAEVAAAIVSGRFDLDRTQMSEQQLVAAFGDWSPVVRFRAAEELRDRPGAKAMVPQLIALAEGKDVHVAQGACETLGNLKCAKALPVYVRLLSHEDRWLRYKAAQAIRQVGNAAAPQLPDILTTFVKTEEPLQPINWADPIQFAHGQIVAALFTTGLTDSLQTVDTKLRYAAVGVASRNADGMARGHLKGYFESKLSAEDVKALAPDILAAVKYIAPADTMFGQDIRLGGTVALSKYHYQEGIRALAELLKVINGHGSETRIPSILNQLKSYGKAARGTIPDMKEFSLMIQHGEMPDHPVNLKKVADINEAIKFIENATDQPDMPTIGPARIK